MWWEGTGARGRAGGSGKSAGEGEERGEKSAGTPAKRCPCKLRVRGWMFRRVDRFVSLLFNCSVKIHHRGYGGLRVKSVLWCRFAVSAFCFPKGDEGGG